jgi:hypothetical protein
MFTGHYAPALALKTRYPNVPLWQLFLAAQAIDILFFLFVPFKIERLTLDYSRSALLALRIEQCYWSHSLVATLAYASLFLVWGYYAKKREASMAIALTIMSHWFLDAFVHTPDVPLAPLVDWKVGLGLWEHEWIAWAVEVAFVGICGALLWRKWAGQRRATWLVGFLLFLIVMQTLTVFVIPLPGSVLQLAVVSQVSFFGFARLAYLVESRSQSSEKLT